ncbi:chemotaxis protein CheB [Pseudonocardia halophobica]|uniref:chemotaxis protein CheB n=1 Tax=Pseudonocardia halophobica TaxID=29401 RepID=UPI00068A79F2|nr:chemotaxis protein CheB [Pseudonocardia halophobica]
MTAGSGTFPLTGRPPRIVVLACSAGGLDALARVLRPLPADLPAAFVVVQHQRPGQGGLLAPILAKRCCMPVHEVRHGELLREGRVYVVPPGRHALATTAGTLALISTDGPPPYRPSADLLLSSLAVTAGPRTIAVILSGGGSDGATGAVAVHDFGGTVLAADEASSAHFAMPAAAIARDDAVDRVLPVDDIAAALVALLGRAELGRAETPTTAAPGPVGRAGI